MITHDATVSKRTLTFPQNPKLAQYGVNADQVKCSFDEEWQGLDIVAVFNKGGRSVPAKVTDDVCVIPPEILAETGSLYVAYAGYAGTEQRIVTKKMSAPLTIEAGGDFRPDPPVGASPDYMAQLIEAAKSGGGSASLPEGGTEGQVLTKTAEGFEWADPADGLPEGGTEGQVLTMTAEGAAWQDAKGGIGEEADVLETVTAAGLVEPVATASGEILTDNDGKIYSL